MTALDNFLNQYSNPDTASQAPKIPQPQEKTKPAGSEKASSLDEFLNTYSAPQPEVTRPESQQPKTPLDSFLSQYGQQERKDTSGGPGSELKKGLERWSTNLRATGTGLTSLYYDMIGDQEKSDAFARGYASIIKEGEPYAPSIGGVEDIKNAEDFFNWAAGMLGEQIPNFISIIGAGGLGSFVGKKVAEKAITKSLGDKLMSEMGQKLLKEGAKKYAIRGAAAGGFTASTSLETGGTYGEQIEAGIERSPWTAITAGVIKGSLELLPLGQVAKSLGLGKVAEKGLLETIQAMPLVKRVLATGALTGATEGGTEALQEAVDIVARKLVDENYDMLGPEARSRILNSAAAGAVVGGTLGAGAGTVGVRGSAKLELNDKDLPPEEPIGPPDTPESAIPKPSPDVPPAPIETQETIESQPEDRLIPLNAKAQELVDSGLLPKDSMIAIADSSLPYHDEYKDRPIKTGTNRTVADIQPGEVTWIAATGLYKPQERAIERQVKKWVKTFLPQEKVALLRTDNMTEVGITTKGASWRDRNGVLYLSMRQFAQRQKAELYETLAHEFGHNIIAATFSKIDQKAKTKIYNAYREYLNRSAESSRAWASEYTTVGSRNLREDAMEVDIPTGQFFAERQELVNIPYHLSFEEWAAQQANRYLQTTERGSSLVTLAFRTVVNLLRKFHNMAKGLYAPNETFEEFMDALADRRLETWGQEVRQAKKVDQREENSITKMVDWETIPAVKGGNPKPAKFNNFMRWIENLIQIERANLDIPGMQSYVEATRVWWADKTAMLDKANERLGEWQLSKPDQVQFSKVLYDTTLESMRLGRRLTLQEKEGILLKQGLAEREDIQVLFDNLQNDFQAAIKMHFDVLRKDAQRNFFGQATELQQALAKLAQEEKQLLNQDYFPLSRFGRYWVRLKAGRPTRIQGESFDTGDTITFEMYETEKQAKERAKQLKRAYPNHLTGFSMVSDITETFAWMPPSMIQSLMNKLNLNQQQQQELKTLLHELAPGQGFKKNLLRRRGIAGFSEDSKRTYAAYFMHFANHHARIKHFPAMNGAMKRIEEHARRVEMAQNGISTRRLSDYIKRHYDYAMNPGEELANIRSAAFLWYLGFNVKSAVVNLTQVPLVAFPFLSAKYGDIGAAKELTLAMKDMRKIWGNRGSGGLNDPDLEWGLDQGIKAGFLNESLATELASVAEGSNLSRLLPGTFLRSEAGAARVRQLSHWGAYLFQTAEKLNRFQVFTAAWRLAQKANPQAPREALFRAAREAVDTTQYEYARWNRPEFMRGKKSVFFMFFNYLQNTLYFATRVPGRGRFFMALLFMAGLQGLPGAEDLMDLWDFAATRLKEKLGWKNPKTDVRLYLRELIMDLGADPDLVMHGTSRVGFGAGMLGDMMGMPIPNVDLSGSLSLGRIVPGLEPAIAGTGDFNTRMAGVTEDVGGAGVSIVTSILKALADDNPDNWKRFERTLPTSIKNLSKAARWYEQGGETARSGANLVSMDPNDPEDFFQIVARGLGFQSTEVAREQELTWTQREHMKYWQIRRSGIMAQYDFALRTKDKEALADMRQALLDFNRTVPIPGLVITGKDIGQSVRARAQGRFKEEAGLPQSLRQYQLYEDIKKTY